MPGSQLVKAAQTHHKRSSRVGHWLPADRKVLNAWLAKTRDAAERKTTPVNPVIRELQETIEGDPVLLMYFTQMFEQQPSFAPPPDTGDIKIRDYHELLQILDHVLTTAPEFTTAGMVGCPINAVLDFPMITPAGLAAFTNAKFNRAVKKVLTAWAQFLDSPASLYVLNETPEGWPSTWTSMCMTRKLPSTDSSRGTTSSSGGSSRERAPSPSRTTIKRS